MSKKEVFASLFETEAFERFAKLSDGDKKKVVKKVKEKVKVKGNGKGKKTDKAEKPEDAEDKSKDEPPEEPPKEEPEPEDSSEEKPAEEVGQSDESDESEESGKTEEPENGLKEIVDGIAGEIEQIKSDGVVTPGEVMGLMDNMMTMVNELLRAKPGRAKKGSDRFDSIIRRTDIASRVADSYVRKAGFEGIVNQVLEDGGWRPGEDFWFERNTLYLGEDVDYRDAGDMVEELNDSGEFRVVFKYDRGDHTLAWR